MEDSRLLVAQNTTAFAEMIKNAYEKGSTESEMTPMKLIEELKLDLKKLMLI